MSLVHITMIPSLAIHFNGDILITSLIVRPNYVNTINTVLRLFHNKTRHTEIRENATVWTYMILQSSSNVSHAGM